MLSWILGDARVVGGGMVYFGRGAYREVVSLNWGQARCGGRCAPPTWGSCCAGIRGPRSPPPPLLHVCVLPALEAPMYPCWMEGFPGAQTVKNLPAVQETRIQSLGREDPLEEGIATHSSTLPGGSHGRRSLAGCSPWGCKESDTTEPLTLSPPLEGLSDWKSRGNE